MIEAVVSGYATLDYVVAAGGEPAARGTSAARLVPGAWPRAGGAPLYAGAQLAAMGVVTTPLVTVGEDLHAAAYRSACAMAGLAADGIATIAGGRSTACLLIHHDDGSYRCFLDPGSPAETLSAAQVAALTGASLVVVAAGEPAITASLLDRLAPHQRLAWIVKADPACFPPVLAARLAARADLVFANAGERGFLGAARRAGQIRVETDGMRPIRIADDAGTHSVAITAVESGDATGAGDSFAGRFLGAWLRGASPDAAAQAAAAAVANLLRARE
ncbi:ribokinase [Sphingomonas zeicaulis]|uniref:carbohydrate kinase family protein n=1 Tax=Sphingomonas zeicaulis TaxID=1632740 RepID=UPI003D205609